jgi:hypothetical protein
MTSTISRRIQRLESRANQVAATATPHLTVCFVNMDKRVTSTLSWEDGKQVWTRFDPPREKAEFDPMA